MRLPRSRRSAHSQHLHVSCYYFFHLIKSQVIECSENDFFFLFNTKKQKRIFFFTGKEIKAFYLRKNPTFSSAAKNFEQEQILFSLSMIFH